MVQMLFLSRYGTKIETENRIRTLLEDKAVRAARRKARRMQYETDLIRGK